MKTINLKLPAIFAILFISALCFAGDSGMSTAAGGSSMCPPGCCTEESFVPNVTISWEKSHWQDVRYDQNGHVLKEMTESQAMNIAKQYLEKYHYEASLKLAEGDKDSYKFEVTNSIFKGKMLEINRKNGWVRQYDSC
ncbi:MAG: hypothetical protein IPP40_14720 [bacterium]|nr:hypothetical protein [bacterium]